MAPLEDVGPEQIGDDARVVQGCTGRAVFFFVETFKEIYRDDFEYEGKRAIVIPLSASNWSRPLRHCLQMALQYHSLKHLPLLGA